MNKNYQIDGISCGGCIEGVKKSLGKHPNIGKIEVSMAPKGATIITMNEDVSVDELQKQLDELNGYTITEIN
ncbi:MAG: copper resistance protein CopZ [Lutibacter sp.]|nr:MAG: copper resistance protein CopZ [Lutibacter sp.]